MNNKITLGELLFEAPPIGDGEHCEERQLLFLG